MCWKEKIKNVRFLRWPTLTWSALYVYTLYTSMPTNLDASRVSIILVSENRFRDYSNRDNRIPTLLQSVFLIYRSLSHSSLCLPIYSSLYSLSRTHFILVSRFVHTTRHNTPCAKYQRWLMHRCISNQHTELNDFFFIWNDVVLIRLKFIPKLPSLFPSVCLSPFTRPPPPSRPPCLEDKL